MSAQYQEKVVDTYGEFVSVQLDTFHCLLDDETYAHVNDALLQMAFHMFLFGLTAGANLERSEADVITGNLKKIFCSEDKK
jgi:hypothetical protein